MAPHARSLLATATAAAVALLATSISVSAASASASASASAAASSGSVPSASAIADSQYWHDRFHGLLSMAAYGDYDTLCPLFFTEAGLLSNYPDSTETPWTLLSEWGPTEKYGVSGFNVIVPEMNKVVMVFRGLESWTNLNATPATQSFIFGSCENCTIHSAAQAAYLEAKEATDDWAVVKTAFESTGHIWSMTGHGFGGMLAQVAALDLGYRGLGQAVHTFGAPPVFNAPAAALYNKLYEGESSFRTVANGDSVPTLIPQGPDYEFVLTGWHVFGTNATFGQNYVICGTDPTEAECAGGNSTEDHYFYYTPMGTCGENNAIQVYNTSTEAKLLASDLAAYSATATQALNSVPADLPTISSSSTTTTTSSSSSSSSIAPSTSASSATPALDASTSATPSSSSSGTTSGAGESVGVTIGSAAVVGMAVLAAFGVVW